MKHPSSKRRVSPISSSQTYSHKYQNIIDMLFEYSKRSFAEHALASAVITRSGDILTIAENDCMHCIVNSSARKPQIRVIPPMHAEEKALVKLRKTKKHLELKYGTRYLRNALDMIVVRRGVDKPILAKPCKNCFLKMIKHGISRVYYTNNNGELEYTRCSIADIDQFNESSLRRNMENSTLTLESVLRHAFNIKDKDFSQKLLKQFAGYAIVLPKQRKIILI